MGKLIHEPALPVDKLEYSLDIHLGQGLEKGIIDVFIDTRIGQAPAPSSLDFNMTILAGGNPPVHLLEPRLQQLFEFSQVFISFLSQNWQADLSNERLFFPPLLVTQQIIFKTTKADTVPLEQSLRVHVT